MADTEPEPLAIPGPEPGSLSLEDELAAYRAAGWKIEEAFWPHRNETPKYYFIAPNGSVFNVRELMEGCFHECDSVTEWSSDERQRHHWVAGRLYVLQTAYKKKYGDYFGIRHAPPEEDEKWRIL